MADKLTDVKARTAKPREKAYKLAAGRGLCLFVMPDGAKYWRFRYRYGGKEKMLSVGVYPIVSLKKADEKAEEARALVAKGKDPSEHRREQKLALRHYVSSTFGGVANAWYDFNLPRWKTATSEKARAYLDKDLLPPLGKRPVAGITPLELADVVERIEKRGAMNVAKKTRQWLNAIFTFAIARGLTKENPAESLGAVAAPAPESKNFAHLTLDELPGLLRALDLYRGSPITKGCCLLALLTANRPGVTRTLRWDELDLDDAMWTIQRKREGMKGGYLHYTPLPHQAVDLLTDLHRLTGTFKYVFIGRNDPRKPISDGAVNAALHRMGYKGKQTMHGFRHLVSTALNEKGYEPDWVERQLAHGDPDTIRGTYNKAHYLDQRRKMMQEWADCLDKLRSGTANVVTLRRKGSGQGR
jgi:integrase